MISDAILQKSLGIELLENQIKIVKSPEKVKIVSAGRGFGKSFTCGYIVLKKFLQGLDELNEGKRETLKIFIVAPTYELTTKVFNEFTRLLLKADRTFKSKISGGKGRPFELNFGQDIWVKCRSAEQAQGMLGERVDLVVIDEAPLLSDLIYQQCIEPLLAYGGEAVYIGTPRGKNWVYHLFIKAKEGLGRFHYKSLDGQQGQINPNFIEEKKKEYGDDLIFRQEYEAEFIEGSMQVFPQSLIESALFPGTYCGAKRGHFYVMGVDLAKSNDYTVINVLDTYDNSQVYFRRFNQIDYTTQIEQIIAVRNEYNGAKVVLDTTGLGEPVKDMLEKRGVFVEDFHFTGITKEAAVSKLRLFLSNKWLKLSDEKVQKEEMEAFEFILRNEKTGEPLKNIKYGAPIGYHDDCVISLALAVWGLFGKAHPESLIEQELRNAKRSKVKQDNFI